MSKHTKHSVNQILSNKSISLIGEYFSSRKRAEFNCLKCHFYLKNLNVKIQKKIFVDFFFPNHNLIVEYNGVQHYKPICFGGISIDKANQNLIKQQDRDAFLRNWCLNNNIELIEIDGRVVYGDKTSRFVIENILPKLGNL